MQYNFEHIFQGQIRELCQIFASLNKEEKLPLTCDHHLTDFTDTSSICFKIYLLKIREYMRSLFKSHQMNNA